MDAVEIAKKELRSCYGPRGIFAGGHHFNDYWARDACFASLGSLELGDHEIVRSNLDLFLESSKPSGQIPLRVGRSTMAILFSHFKLGRYIRKPIFANDKSSSSPKDQNSLLIICAYNYVNKTKDVAWLKKNISGLVRVMDWNLNRTHNHLLLEDWYCNWADSIKKRGKVLYTNVCYAHSLYCMSQMLAMLGVRKHVELQKLYEKTKSIINMDFWSGEHYIDWIDGEIHYNYFSTDGNVLAILWDIADAQKARHIEEASHIFDVNDVPSQCVHPKYPSNLVSMQIRFMGLPDYHNGLSWLWLGCIGAIAKYKLGFKQESHALLAKIARIIERHNRVYEIYENNGNPVRRIYRSEVPFAWSSGLFIYAASLCKGFKNKDYQKDQ